MKIDDGTEIYVTTIPNGIMHDVLVAMVVAYEGCLEPSEIGTN